MDRKKYLTLAQLNKSGRIWWIKSIPTLKRWIKIDQKNRNLLKAIIVDNGKTVRYYFLQQNVENYIREFEKGKV